MTNFLVDNSVLQRLGRAATVADEVTRLVIRGDVLCICLPTLLEAGYSARSAADHDRILASLNSFVTLEPTQDIVAVALNLQRTLWRAGSGRSAGAVDLELAATAVVHNAVILHYDNDFQVLSDLDPRVKSAWVVPRGTVS